MLMRRLLTMLCVVNATLFGVAACAPGAQSPNSAAISVPAAETAADTATDTATVTEAEAETVTETVTTAENEVQSREDGSVVSETPQADPGAAAAPSGQADPGAAGEGSQTQPQGSDAQPLAGGSLVYTDSTYGFSVRYPADYLFRTEPAEKLASLEPRPVASFILMNPTLATSDIVELEPADLEIRVHSAEGAASLEEWLAAHGFLDESNRPAQPFQAANVMGLKVCSSTMIAPGCSYFVWGEEWVYQLVPSSAAGETIMSTFTLVR